VGIPKLDLYGASKHAMLWITETQAAELAVSHPAIASACSCPA
jgi:hypothetical protein